MGNTLVPGKAREAELARMMEAYGPQLVGTCAMLLGDAHLAQDAVQEAFIRAYDKMDTLRGERENSERAWLMRIAINICRDHQRTRWFRFVDRRVSLDMLPEIVAPESERDQSILLAVQSLPGKYREVVLLHYYQDMEAAEIAKALGVSLSSVYRRLEKARQLLKTTLERWDFDA